MAGLWAAWIATSPAAPAGLQVRGDYVFFRVASPRTDGGLGYATEASIIGKISF